MGPTCKSYVLELLENSSHRLRQIELMRYELQHIPQVSDSEMIEAMSLPSLTSSEKATNSKVVPDVALSYKKTAERMNAEALGELASAYVNLWREHDRLQHYIGLLDERQGRVLRLYYFVWGDRIFEKCGIGRDEGGDGGKTLEIRGKRRLPARDRGANYQQS